MARVYVAASMGEADIRVAVVTDMAEADLLVYRVSSWGLAHGDGLWFITPNREDAATRISLTSRGMAEVLVCFVDASGQAGWTRQHRLQGRFK